MLKKAPRPSILSKMAASIATYRIRTRPMGFPAQPAMPATTPPTIRRMPMQASLLNPPTHHQWLRPAANVILIRWQG